MTKVFLCNLHETETATTPETKRKSRSNRYRWYLTVSSESNLNKTERISKLKLKLGGWHVPSVTSTIYFSDLYWNFSMKPTAKASAQMTKLLYYQ